MDNIKKIAVFVMRLSISASNRGDSSFNTQNTKPTTARPKVIEITLPEIMPSNTVKGRKFKSSVLCNAALL